MHRAGVLGLLHNAYHEVQFYTAPFAICNPKILLLHLGGTGGTGETGETGAHCSRITHTHKSTSSMPCPTLHKADTNALGSA